MEAQLGVEWGEPYDGACGRSSGVPVGLRDRWSLRIKANPQMAEWEAEGKTICAGGMFDAFLEHAEVTGHHLDIVWRMRQAWGRAASLQLRASKVDAVDDYATQGRIRSLDHFGLVLDDFAQAALNGQEILVTAHSNAAANQLNDALQARIIGARDPATERVLRWNDGVRLRERRIGEGDPIRIRKNWWNGCTSRGRAAVNGATWTVTASTPAGLWVESSERGHTSYSTLAIWPTTSRTPAHPSSTDGRPPSALPTDISHS